MQFWTISTTGSEIMGKFFHKFFAGWGKNIFFWQNIHPLVGPKTLTLIKYLTNKYLNCRMRASPHFPMLSWLSKQFLTRTTSSSLCQEFIPTSPRIILTTEQLTKDGRTPSVTILVSTGRIDKINTLGKLNAVNVLWRV